MAVSEFWAIEQRHKKLLLKVERLEQRIVSLEEIISIGDAKDGNKSSGIMDKIMKKPLKKATG
jgi:hypothetical protein